MDKINKTKILSFWIVTLLSWTTFAAIPTPESLFRNASNKKVDGNFVILNLSIKEVENQIFLEQTLANEDGGERFSFGSEKQKAPKLYLQLLFEIPKTSEGEKQDKKISMLQNKFETQKFQKESIEDSIFFTSLTNRVINDNQTTRSIFYGVMTMLATNSEHIIVEKLQQLIPRFKTNKELLNREKMRLLEEYKRYLKSVQKNDEELSEIAENKELTDEEREKLMTEQKNLSPLKSEDEERQKEINEIMSSRMYEIDKHVKLIKDGVDFFWKLDYHDLQAEFSNHDQKLKSLKLKTDGSPVELNLRKYVLYDGVHELPKVIYFKAGDQKLFRVNILKYKNFENSGSSLDKKASEYSEILRDKKSKNVKEVSEEPTVSPQQALEFIY